MARSKAVERAEAKTAYNAFLAVCPSRQLLERISNKWVVLILCALGGDATAPNSAPNSPRALRYSELSRLLAGVSQKMLTQTLRTLERDGLVVRTVTPAVPVRVDYDLTPLGRTLLPVMRAIKVWAEAHIEEVESARVAYDSKPG